MQENFLHDKSVAAFIVTEYIQLKAFTTLHIQGTIACTTWYNMTITAYFSRNKSQTQANLLAR